MASDLVQRRFNPEAPNQLWSGDITYIATEEGWVYLGAVINLLSWQVVGGSMRAHMQTSLVKDALTMAWFRRRPEAGLIFHSDRDLSNVWLLSGHPDCLGCQRICLIAQQESLDMFSRQQLDAGGPSSPRFVPSDAAPRHMPPSRPLTAGG